MILHVIMRAVSEEDGWANLTYDRANLSQKYVGIEHFKITGDGRMPYCSHDFCGSFRLVGSSGGDLDAGSRHTSEIASGEVEAMNLPTGIAQQTECSRHQKFYVIGMRGNGESYGR